MNPSKEQSESLPETIPGLLAGFARELRCSICLSTLRDATSTPCGHIFCKECIHRALIHLDHKNCPLCNTEVTKRQLYEAECLQKIVNEFNKMREAYENENHLDLSQRPAESWDREYKSLQAKDNKDNQNTKEKTNTLEKPKKQMQPLRRLPSTLSESDYYVEPLIRKRKKDGA